MIVSPHGLPYTRISYLSEHEQPQGTPYRRITSHVFSLSELTTGGGDSGVAWWNANDHASPFPWRIDRARCRCVNSYVTESTDIAPTMAVLHAWAIDSDGSELFELLFDLAEAPLGGADYPDGTPHAAYGIKFKIDSLPGGSIVIDLGQPCFLLWDFFDETGFIRQGLPLPPI